MQEIFEDANAVDMAGVAEEKKDEALARWFLRPFFFFGIFTFRMTLPFERVAWMSEP